MTRIRSDAYREHDNAAHRARRRWRATHPDEPYPTARESRPFEPPAWRNANREKTNADQRARWAAFSPDMRSAIRSASNSRTRMIKYGTPPPTPGEYQASIQWQLDHLHDLCPCGAPSEHTDHVIPLSQGGTDLPSNRQRLCAPCHKAKSKLEVNHGKNRVHA